MFSFGVCCLFACCLPADKGAQDAYFEAFDEISDAIAREKELKKWRRPWKIELIEKDNPGWDDLYFRITAS